MDRPNPLCNARTSSAPIDPANKYCLRATPPSPQKQRRGEDGAHKGCWYLFAEAISELKREIPSASKKALTASLRSLEAARVVLRRDLSSSVLHVEYELADAMREPLVALLDHLAEWGKLYDLEARSTIPFSTKSEGVDAL